MTFDNEEIKLIWDRAEKVTGIASNIYRKDECGAWIAYNEFGNANSSFGWQIDFSKYKHMDKDNELDDLIPLHCQNYRSKADGKLVCTVTKNWHRPKQFSNPKS